MAILPTRAHATIGRYGAATLLLAGSARETAMGGGCAALDDTVHAADFNPAGISMLDRPEVGFQHSAWLVNTRISHCAAAVPSAAGVVGIGVTYVDYGGMTRRSETGRAAGEFSADDALAELCFARHLSAGISVGARCRYFQQRIDRYTCHAYPIDLGALFSLVPGRLSAGIAWQNIGARTTRLHTRREQLPQQLRLGMALRPMSGRCLITAEYASIGLTEARFSAGCEAHLYNAIFLRAGLVSSAAYVDDVLFRTGCGVRIGDYFIDYVFEPFGELDTCHTISIRIRI